MRRLLIALSLVAICSQVFAWSEAGHKIVGSIAYRQLTPEQQTKLVAILKKHPRWDEDFKSKMPEELTTEAEQNEWIFQQAAVWPDIARGFQGEARKDFTRGPWHYIDLPTFLTPEDQAALERNLEIAREIGAQVEMLEGPDSVEGLIRFAKELGVTQIFIGHSKRRGWWNQLRGNPVDRLIDAAEGIDVRVFPQEPSR